MSFTKLTPARKTRLAFATLSLTLLGFEGIVGVVGAESSPPVSLNTVDRIGEVVMAIWMIAAIIAKLGMIATSIHGEDPRMTHHSQRFSVAAISLWGLMWVLLYFSLPMHPEMTSVHTLTSGGFLLEAVFLFGTPLVDAFNAAYPAPKK